MLAKTAMKKIKINWADIRVTIVPADEDHPNAGNPYAGMSPSERDEHRIALCGRIWARHVREQVAMQATK